MWSRHLVGYKFNFVCLIVFFKGYFEFADGLRYHLDTWDYCNVDTDRAFKSEDENGLKPAGS